MNMIDKRPSFQPVTLADPKPDPDPRAQPIQFTLTPQLRDAAVMCRLDIIAMKAHRESDGLVTGTATQTEWDQAVAAFRGHL